METSRSDEKQPSVDRTLGERMVMVARMMAAEHVRQELEDAGVDLVRVQRELRERVVRRDLFEPLQAQADALKDAVGGKPKGANPFADAGAIALPQRVTIQRRAAQTIADIDAEIDANFGRREAA